MASSSCSGHPGPARGRRRRSWPSVSACPTSRPATCSGPRSATASPVGLEARRYMERGQLVPDDITIQMLLERLSRARRRAGRHPRRLPAQPRPGRGARRGARQGRGSPVDRALSIDVPSRRAGPAPVGPLGLPRQRPRLPRAAPIRRAAPGVCDLRRIAAHPARRRPGRDRPGPTGRDAAEPARRASTTTEPRACCAGDRRRPADRAR